MHNSNDLNQSVLEKYVNEVVIDKLHMDKNLMSQKNITVNIDK